MDHLVTTFMAELARQLDAQCQIYRYKADFQTLWSDQVLNDKPVLIVWEEAHLGDPNDRDEMLLEKHLTPLDWALAWSLRNANVSLSPIIIVDLTPASWAHSWAWRVRHQLVADMPWLQLTSLVPAALPGNQPHTLAMQPPLPGGETDRQDTEGVIRCVREADGSARWSLLSDWETRKLSDEEKAALAALHDLWVGSLNQTDEHHDVNNVIGGWMLLAESSNLPKGQTMPVRVSGGGPHPSSSVVNAFLMKIYWSSRTPSDAARHWQPRRARQDDPDIYGRKPRVTIYDDKAAAGWEEVIKVALRHVTDDVVRGELSSLIDQLEKSQYLERHFKPAVEIILLDLRLYESQDSEALHTHATRLVRKAREIARHPGRLAWSPIEADELTEIENWLRLKKRTADRAYLQTLLLLPRMVALARPLTPIILFSSSSQARVREVLKPYRNIFTGFQKPNPLNDPQSIEASADAFSRGVEFALPLLRRGIQLAELDGEARKLNARPVQMDSAHADLYFDETGQPERGVISAVACNIYERYDVSGRIQESFLEQLHLAAGTIWSKRVGVNAQPLLRKSNELRRRDIASGQVLMLVQHLKAVEGALDYADRWMVSGIRAPAYRPKAEATLSSFPDLHLDRAIRANLLFALFVYLPYVCRSSNLTVAIHLPTRVLPMIAGSLEKEFCLYRVNMENVMTYSRDAAFPLVRAWLQSWGDAFEAVAKKIVSIVGRSLTPRNGIPDDQHNRGHLFHDVADWAAGAVGVNGDGGDYRTEHIQGAFREHGLYGRRFTCIDEENDLVDLEKLLTALSDIRKAPVSLTVLADVIAGLERTEVLASRSGLERLKNNSSLAHHRLVVWTLMAHLKTASGEALMPARLGAA